jgi:hypothetical protein
MVRPVERDRARTPGAAARTLLWTSMARPRTQGKKMQHVSPIVHGLAHTQYALMAHHGRLRCDT